MERLDCQITHEFMDLIKGTYNGFSFETNQVKHDILVKKVRFLDPPIVIEGVRLASLRDIAISKLNVITERAEKRDFVDLYFLHHQLNLVSLFTNEFFKVFPLQKSKGVLASLASTPNVMKGKSLMPEMITPVENNTLNKTMITVAEKCVESILHRKQRKLI